jgi:hypothetical protein
VEIPYEWIATPVLRRPTAVINSAAIQQAGAATAYSSDAASIKRYGVGPASATLTTPVDADASNLATHLTTYYATPRPRQPVLAFHLMARTEDECALLLSVGLGRRVRIIHTPTNWPVGAANFVVEGVRHTLAVDDRTVEWSTAALIGASPTFLDTFDRTTTSGWGNTWSVVSGAASQFSTNGSSALMTHSAPGFCQISLPYVSLNDDFVATCSVSSIANYGDAAVQLRFTDTNNYYRAVHRFDANAFEIDVRTNGVTSTIAGPVSPLAAATVGPVKIRFQANGSQLRARAWLASGTEPTAWQLTATDSTFASGTGIALSSFDATAAKTFTYDDVSVYNGTNTVPGPWFRWDTSTWDGSDLRPF